MRHSDRLFGTVDVGGTPHATITCPIFDTRPGGNFAHPNKPGIKPTDGPFHLNPFDKLFIRILNVLAVPGYRIGEDYGLSEEDFSKSNWERLVKIGESIFARAKTTDKFIQSVTSIVRPEIVHELDGRLWVAKVTSPAFGQVIPYESTMLLVRPTYQSGILRTQREQLLADVYRRQPGVDRRINAGG
jgi:hypothetical protein